MPGTQVALTEEKLKPRLHLQVAELRNEPWSPTYWHRVIFWIFFTWPPLQLAICEPEWAWVSLRVRRDQISWFYRLLPASHINVWYLEHLHLQSPGNFKNCLMWGDAGSWWSGRHMSLRKKTNLGKGEEWEDTGNLHSPPLNYTRAKIRFCIEVSALSEKF